MMWWLLPIAQADPPPAPFARLEQARKVRRYSRIRGEGPVYARSRSRRGAYEAWTWPDGVVEHLRRYDKREPVEIRRFDAGGRPLTSVMLTADGPATVAVHGSGDPVSVDVSGWAEQAVGPVRLRAPAELQHALVPDGSVFDDTFRTELLATCGCVIEDRGTVWLDGHPAARYRVRVPDYPVARVGNVWALPVGEQVLLMTWLVDGGDGVEARLAPGRAAAALLTVPEGEGP